MRTLLRSLAIPALLLLPALGPARAGEPSGAIIMEKIAPDQAAPGVFVSITGQNLDAKHIKFLFLFNGDMNVPVDLVDQKAGLLKFKVPVLPSGKYSIVVEEVASGMLLEEPVFLRVVAPPLPTGL